MLIRNTRTKKGAISGVVLHFHSAMRNFANNPAVRSNRCSLLRSKIHRLDREHATGGDDAKAR
jgi:hypothetical protein